MMVGLAFLIMLVCFAIGITLHEVGEKNFSNDTYIIGSIIMIIGSVFLGIMFAISAGVTLCTSEFQYILKQESKLEAFSDNFFIQSNRSFGVNTVLTFTYMIKENGAMKVKHKEINNSVEILETDDAIAMIKTYRKTIKTDNILLEMFFMGDDIITVFEIPKNSIKYEYAIDLE